MPFSLLIQVIPKSDVPVPHVQGPALQGMFLHLLEEVDPELARHLHADNRYRPYTLSPLGIGEPTPGPSQEGKSSPGKFFDGPSQQRVFEGFCLPRSQKLKAGTPCYLRLTLLEDMIFPTFSRYFLERREPEFYLGNTTFIVTNILATSDNGNPWSAYYSYAELIEQALPTQRQIALQFLTPTSFRQGDVDLPLPLPRLVFRSWRKRFEEFYQVAFLPDFDELVERFTGIAHLNAIRTDTIKTKQVPLIGFTGSVAYDIHRNAPPDFVLQMNLLADYAFFCGTGRKTTLGMGQTIHVRS